MEGEQRTDSFLDLNPAGLVPVIKEGEEFVLFESAAIAAYIVNSRGKGQTLEWYPADPKTRALVDAYMQLFHSVLGSSGKAFFYTVGPKLFGLPPKPEFYAEQVKEGVEMAVAAAARIDADLKRRESMFIAGTVAPTIADLQWFQAFAQLYSLELINDEMFSGKIAFLEWYAAIDERPSSASVLKYVRQTASDCLEKKGVFAEATEEEGEDDDAAAAAADAKKGKKADKDGKKKAPKAKGGKAKGKKK